MAGKAPQSRSFVELAGGWSDPDVLTPPDRSGIVAETTKSRLLESLPTRIQQHLVVEKILRGCFAAHSGIDVIIISSAYCIHIRGGYQKIIRHTTTTAFGWVGTAFEIFVVAVGVVVWL